MAACGAIHRAMRTNFKTVLNGTTPTGVLSFFIGAPEGIFRRNAPIASHTLVAHVGKNSFLNCFLPKAKGFLPPCSNPYRTKKESTNRKGCYSLLLARPKGFEPPTFRIGIYCTIQLCYGRIKTDFVGLFLICAETPQCY